MYFRMSRADKNKVQRPENPIRPYIKLKKGDKVWYKKKEELTEEDKKLLPPVPLRPGASEKEKEKFNDLLKEWKKNTEKTSKINTNKDNISYFLDGKAISQTDANSIEVNTIKSVNVVTNKTSGKNVYITSKK